MEQRTSKRVRISVLGTFHWKNTCNWATRHEGEKLDPPEIDGDAFVDGDAFISGGVSTFLVEDGALICSRDRPGFGRLFLWSINKQTQDQQRWTLRLQYGISKYLPFLDASCAEWERGGVPDKTESWSIQWKDRFPAPSTKITFNQVLGRWRWKPHQRKKLAAFVRSWW